MYRKSVHVYKSCNSHPSGYIGLLKLCMSCSNERFVCSATKPDRCAYIHDTHKHKGWVSVSGWGGGWVTRAPDHRRWTWLPSFYPSTESLSLSLCAIFILPLMSWSSGGFIPQGAPTADLSLRPLYCIRRCISFAYLSNKRICTKIKKGRFFSLRILSYGHILRLVF